MGGLQSALNSVKGYTDLPGYKDPIDGKRYDNLNTEENLPIISSLSRVPEDGLADGHFQLLS